MDDPSDFELDKGEAPLPEPSRSGGLPLGWIVLAVVIIAAAVLGWRYRASREAAEPPETTVSETAPSPAPDRPLGGAAAPIDVPPLDQTDALVRRLVGDLSSHPRVAAWLASDDLIRRFVVAVDNIASGTVPRQALAPLRPQGRFAAIETGTARQVDPRSYARYSALAAAVESVDADGAARLYTVLKPRIEEAHAELGSGESFDRTLERAIVSLLRAPVLEGNVALEPEGGVFRYADPSVERLAAAQKQLIRMGPANVRTIQGTLRAISLALGIPPERLPS